MMSNVKKNTNNRLRIKDKSINLFGATSDTILRWEYLSVKLVYDAIHEVRLRINFNIKAELTMRIFKRPYSVY